MLHIYIVCDCNAKIVFYPNQFDWEPSENFHVFITYNSFEFLSTGFVVDETYYGFAVQVAFITTKAMS